MPARPAPTIKTLTCSRSVVGLLGMGVSWGRWLTRGTLSTLCRVSQLLVELVDAMYGGSRANCCETQSSRQRTRPPGDPRQRRRPRAGDPRDDRAAAGGAAAERDLGR